MTHRQDDVERTCEICHLKIEKDQWMMDLFRSLIPEGKTGVKAVAQPVKWVHESCARAAVEQWLRKRWERLKEQSQEQTS